MATSPRWIDFRELPASAGGFSTLYLDYLAGAPEIRPFFPESFRNGKGFETVMERIAGHQPDRATLVRVLAEQNAALGAGQRALDNIQLLAHPTTFAVVTGQQVGLFGGPLYSFYKTITALKLARHLKAKFPLADFIPVFWLEGEDHDFLEMNNTAILDQESQLLSIRYLPGGEEPTRNLGPIGELAFDGTLEQNIAALAGGLQKTEFTEGLLAALRSAYQPGRTFNQAYAAWFAHVFRDSGLVFVSCHDPELKRLVSPIFAREVAEFPAVSQLVIEQSATIEQQYHAQIKTKSINLFLFHKGGRYLIEPRETDFSLKGTRHFLSREELASIAAQTPELLSPNVVLRPIVQDTLLPTVAYVAGPGEVAYHAQLAPVYAHFGTVRPVIYPRASVSLLEERVVRTAEKYDLRVEEFFGERERIIARVMEQLSEVKVDTLFDTADRGLQSVLTELRFGITEVDSTLLPPLENIGGKIKQQLGVLRQKTVAAQERQHEAAVRQIDRVFASLLPEGTLQERTLNLLSFLNKYGPDFVDWLQREIDIDGFKHQMLAR